MCLASEGANWGKAMLLNEENSTQSNFQDCCGHSQATNSSELFIASSLIPAIYIQNLGYHSFCQVKLEVLRVNWTELWFQSKYDTLESSSNTTVDKNRAFSSPPTPDTLLILLITLGYQWKLIHLSNVTTNDMFQPVEGTCNIISSGLYGSTSGLNDRELKGVPAAKPSLKTQREADTANKRWQERGNESRRGTRCPVLLNLQTPKKKSRQNIIYFRGLLPSNCNSGVKESSSYMRARIIWLSYGVDEQMPSVGKVEIKTEARWIQTWYKRRRAKWINLVPLVKAAGSDLG
ncbi:hypothetical protein Tco_1575225 [Tanacetum coccineum]